MSIDTPAAPDRSTMDSAITLIEDHAPTIYAWNYERERDQLVRPHVGEHGEDAAVGVGRRPQLELGEDVGDVLLDRAAAEHQLAGDAQVRAALGHEGEDLDLAR